ncbi:MAG: tRNA (adenosine(37)-N6)-dimethylallyltransferase MiaA [Bacteroidales bacterium]|jgi:tRNA dimethylallyltransferase|nr:tRNA (adenosine(37)-N6)-dimethylallyltransferase MiaA [Bacteroidales bacterium]MCI2122005.1 tRNA (adenosine(37)-N6)-dimethylallyltransferase MiaA [Bacteroidales bacterium]MCI2145191.1 tRNA (adenosine(37)-N6)-dimethylallyltransferase MiaA [Bacteroidales bacterium]
MNSGKRLIIILGPTAVGKTAYAINMAKKVGSPVISCDSRQVYSEMKIGTAVPSPEELAEVRHYFIGCRSVLDYYTAGLYEMDAMALTEELFKTHDTLVMCGGSGLYIDAVCNGLDDFPPADKELRALLMGRLEKEGLESLRRDLAALDPESYAAIDIANPQRVVRALEVTIATGRKFSSYKRGVAKTRPFAIEKIGLTMQRDALYSRIDARVDRMMDEGLEGEVRSLVPYQSLTALRTVGYREIFAFLKGSCSLSEAVDSIKLNTRHYAKKQMTYFGRDASINWINV